MIELLKAIVVVMLAATPTCLLIVWLLGPNKK